MSRSRAKMTGPKRKDTRNVRRGVVTTARHGCKQMLKRVFVCVLLFVGPQLVAQNTSGDAQTVATNPALLNAVKSGDVGALRELLNKKADPNAADVDGSTGLHWAAYRADLESLKLLIGAGADPNLANQFGSTPLLLAAKAPDSALVKVLLDKGADPRHAAPDGETPLMVASRAARNGDRPALASTRRRSERHGEIRRPDGTHVGRVRESPRHRSSVACSRR